MPRIVKHPEIRKAELVAAAQALFFERGYDATKVDDIIQRSGVSKGAFYYYFPSKEAVLEAMAALMAEDLVRNLRAYVDDPCLNAFEQLNGLLREARKLKIDQAPVVLSSFAVLFRPENLPLYHRIHGAVSAVTVPLIAEIVRHGVAEGTFLSDDPDLTAEIIIGLTATTHRSVARLFDARTDDAFCEAATAFERRWMAQGIAIDRILGLPDGSLQFVEPGFAEALFAQWRQQERSEV